MISFNNTEIAFRIKTNRELKKAFILFKAISNRALVRVGGGLANLAFGIRLPIGWIVKPTIYSHFCGGETIEDCLPKIRKLAAHNVRSVLDYSVEGKEEPEEIESAINETMRTVSSAAENPDIPFAVFKPTAFSRSSVLEKKSAGTPLTDSEQQEASQFRNRIDRLCKMAYENDVRIMVDAEEICYQDFIDEVVADMMKSYNRQKAIVYNTYQMYRWDRLEKFKKDLQQARDEGFFLGIKFVRGAYMERERERAQCLGYPSPIHSDKEDTDRDYDAALKFAIENIDKVSIFNGTHNEKSSLHLTRLMKEFNLSRDDERCYFSQLFGMSDHISFNLANEGYRVVKYLPYGPVRSVLPYLIRRTEENTSMAGQTSRELSLIMTERRRRKENRK